MTDNLDMVTTIPLSINSSAQGRELISSCVKDDVMQEIENFFSAQLQNLFLGIDPNDCPLPCRTFSTEVKLYLELDEYFAIYLNFLPTVEVNGLIQFSFIIISCI